MVISAAQEDLLHSLSGPCGFDSCTPTNGLAFLYCCPLKNLSLFYINCNLPSVWTQAKCKSGPPNLEKPLRFISVCFLHDNTVREDDTAFNVSVSVKLFTQTQFLPWIYLFKTSRDAKIWSVLSFPLWLSLLSQIAVNSSINIALSYWYGWRGGFLRQLLQFSKLFFLGILT